jgi:hypothetical protein
MTSTDAHEIQSIISRYTNCVNRRAWSELGDIFAADAVWTAPAIPDATFHGHAEVVAGIPRLVEDTVSLIQLNTPSDIAIDGDTAKARCSIRETGTNSGVRFEAHGWYDDRLVRENGKWKFAHRTFNLIENYFTPVSTFGTE